MHVKAAEKRVMGDRHDIKLIVAMLTDSPYRDTPLSAEIPRVVRLKQQVRGLIYYTKTPHYCILQHSMYAILELLWAMHL
jgi:hypothetical protein